MSDDAREREALGFLFRHLVAVLVTYRHKNDPADEPKRVATYSGTIISTDGMIAVLTAGHCVQEIEDLRASAAVELCSIDLIDCFGSKAVHPLPMPLGVEATCIAMVDDELGFDVGLILLQPFQMRTLAANGVEPISEEVWQKQPQAGTVGRFIVLGLPMKHTSARAQNAHVEVSPSRLAVVPAEDDSRISAKHFPRFVGKVINPPPLDEVRGMSGGPILGFTPDARKYWVVAIQTSYDRSTATVFGCPIQLIGRLISHAASNLRSQSDAAQPIDET